MSKELAPPDFTPEQLKLITSTVAKGATPDELTLFLYRCKTLGLDPLKPGQVHFIKFGGAAGAIVVGLEGFRSRAAATGKLAGVKRGAIRNADGHLLGAWAEVYRSDWKECAREEVPLSEYNTGKGPWAKMPETMIKKVAECAALRMAFPDALGGVYESAEMDQANQPPVRAEQPPSDGSDGSTTELGYKITFGQWKGRSIEEVYRNHGPEKLEEYVVYLEGVAEKKGQPLGEGAQEFIREVETYLGALENKPLGITSPIAREILESTEDDLPF